MLGLEARTVRMIQTFESLVEQKKVYLTYYQSCRDFYGSLSEIQGLEDKSKRFISMHGLGLRDVEYPGELSGGGDPGWEEYCSYTALICDEIRRERDRVQPV